jgi:hypothetical protein
MPRTTDSTPTASTTGTSASISRKAMTMDRQT